MSADIRGGNVEVEGDRIAILEAKVDEMQERLHKLESHLPMLQELGGQIARLRSEVEEYQQP